MSTSSPHSMLPVRTLWTAFALILSVAPAACSDLASTDQTVKTTPPGPLTLLAAGASQSSVQDELGTFQTQSSLTVNPTFDSAGALQADILGGMAADVAIVTPAVITALTAQNLVLLPSRVDLAQIGGGIAVRTGDARPDISTDDALRTAINDADEIHYADPAVATAGKAFAALCAKLGVAAACASTTAAVPGKGHFADGGADAMAAMAESTAAHVIGATQLSEILSTPGVVLVGEYPTDLQTKTIYSAIILAGTKDVSDAHTLLRFLSSPVFIDRMMQSGFEEIPAAPATTP